MNPMNSKTDEPMNTPDEVLETLAVFQKLLEHRDNLPLRVTREVTDKHLLPIPFAPATWGGLRAVVESTTALQARLSIAKSSMDLMNTQAKRDGEEITALQASSKEWEHKWHEMAQLSLDQVTAFDAYKKTLFKEKAALGEQLDAAEARCEKAEQEVKRLNAWADSFTDIHLKERMTGDALIKELREQLTRK